MLPNSMDKLNLNDQEGKGIYSQSPALVRKHARLAVKNVGPYETKTDLNWCISRTPIAIDRIAQTIIPIVVPIRIVRKPVSGWVTMITATDITAVIPIAFTTVGMIFFFRMASSKSIKYRLVAV